MALIENEIGFLWTLVTIDGCIRNLLRRMIAEIRDQSWLLIKVLDTVISLTTNAFDSGFIGGLYDKTRLGS